MGGKRKERVREGGDGEGYSRWGGGWLEEVRLVSRRGGGMGNEELWSLIILMIKCTNPILE